MRMRLFPYCIPLGLAVAALAPGAASAQAKAKDSVAAPARAKDSVAGPTVGISAEQWQQGLTEAKEKKMFVVIDSVASTLEALDKLKAEQIAGATTMGGCKLSDSFIPRSDARTVFWVTTRAAVTRLGLPDPACNLVKPAK